MRIIYLNQETFKRLIYARGISERNALLGAGLNRDLLVQMRRKKCGISVNTLSKLSLFLGCDPADLISDHFENVRLALDSEQVQFRAYCKGLTEKRLQEEAGISAGTLSTTKRKKALPRPETVAKIADILECDPAKLIIKIEADEEEEDNAEDKSSARDL